MYPPENYEEWYAKNQQRIKKETRDDLNFQISSQRIDVVGNWIFFLLSILALLICIVGLGFGIYSGKALSVTLQSQATNLAILMIIAFFSWLLRTSWSDARNVQKKIRGLRSDLRKINKSM